MSHHLWYMLEVVGGWRPYPSWNSGPPCLHSVTNQNIKLEHSIGNVHIYQSIFWGLFFIVIKVLSLLEGCLDLIFSPSPSVKIQIKGGKIVQNSGVQIPALEGQNCFVIFSFHFQILHTKMGIFDFNHFLISLVN